jgi:uncharacterized repeat protein (TIGR03803 family)
MLFVSACVIAPFNTASAWVHQVLHDFCQQGSPTCADGWSPRGRLLKDNNGNLYGAVGLGRGGAIFELVKNGATYEYQVLHVFCQQANCADGRSPGTLTIDTNGTLYGTTYEGGTGVDPWGGTEEGSGTIFMLRPGSAGWTFSKLYDFCKEGGGCKLGAFVADSLTYRGASSGHPYDGQSALYGATFSGGLGNSGVVFRWKPNGEYDVIHNFCIQPNCSDGTHASDLIMDANGNLYAAARYSGALDGLAFELSPSGSGFVQTILYRFCQKLACADGSDPNPPLAFGPDGSLLGTTWEGGSHGRGTIFRLSPRGGHWYQTVLWNFDLPFGYPEDGPALNPSYGLFGWTQGGSTMVFKFDHGVLDNVHTFCQSPPCLDGKYVYGPLLLDSSGNVFGVTGGGGAYGQGVVFEISP